LNTKSYLVGTVLDGARRERDIHHRNPVATETGAMSTARDAGSTPILVLDHAEQR